MNRTELIEKLKDYGLALKEFAEFEERGSYKAMILESSALYSRKQLEKALLDSTKEEIEALTTMESPIKASDDRVDSKDLPCCPYCLSKLENFEPKEIQYDGEDIEANLFCADCDRCFGGTVWVEFSYSTYKDEGAK